MNWPIIIELNGEKRKLSHFSLQALLISLNLDTKPIAIALNDTIVPASLRETIQLKEGDRLEIIRAAAGG